FALKNSNSGLEGLELHPAHATAGDAVAQFFSQSSTLGVFAIVVVAAAALAFDSRPERAIFYRTRRDNVSALIVPRLVVSIGAGVVATGIALVACLYET